MVRAKAQFDDSFLRIHRIDSLYLHARHAIGLPPAELEDLLRSEIVYAVSALDRMIHELVKIGMVNIFLGARPVTMGYTGFQLTLGQHQEVNAPAATGLPPGEMIFRGIIEQKHSYLSYQDPIKIKEALNYIWDEPYKWQRIAIRMGSSETVVKQTLSNIVIRRNQIAHEMDLDLATGAIQNISHADTITSVTFIKNVGQAIYDLVI